jgi:arabinofuranosyltransferase
MSDGSEAGQRGGSGGAVARLVATGPLLLSGAVVALVWLLWEPVPHVDDAYISYRYARNWVEGQGLVYNLGERVEGFTNLSWTLLVALGLAAGAGAREVAHGLGLASGVAVLVATWALARSGLSDTRAWLAGVAPWLVLASTGFQRWATAGLETPLFVALATAALAAAIRRRLGLACVFLVLSTLTRPEGVLLAGLVFGFSFLLDDGARSRLWKPAILFAVALLALTAFRLAYYGSPLPNTFYAKVGGVPRIWGVLYAVDFLANGAVWLVPPALLAVATQRRWWAPAAWIASGLAYVIWIGGDALGHSRLLLPVLPALAAMAVAGTAWAQGRALGLGAAALVCLTLAVVWSIYGGVPTSLVALRHPKRERVLHETRRFDASFEEVGYGKATILKRRGESDALVAIGAIGSFGYHSRLPILDILGLVDPEIARSRPDEETPRPAVPGHQRWNTASVFAREPKYILIARKDTPGKGKLPAVFGIWSDPALERDYLWDPGIHGYRRRVPTGAAVNDD